MGMERERRNPSAVDIPHSVKAIRGIDAERAEESVISFDEMRSYVGFARARSAVRSARGRRRLRRRTAACGSTSAGTWRSAIFLTSATSVGRVRGEPERGIAREVAYSAEQAWLGDERLQQEDGDARQFVGAGVAQGGLDMNTSACCEYQNGFEKNSQKGGAFTLGSVDIRMIWTIIAPKSPICTPSFPRKRESRGLRMLLTGGSHCSLLSLLSNVNTT